MATLRRGRRFSLRRARGDAEVSPGHVRDLFPKRTTGRERDANGIVPGGEAPCARPAGVLPERRRRRLSKLQCSDSDGSEYIIRRQKRL